MYLYIIVLRNCKRLRYMLYIIFWNLIFSKFAAVKKLTTWLIYRVSTWDYI